MSNHDVVISAMKLDQETNPLFNFEISVSLSTKTANCMKIPPNGTALLTTYILCFFFLHILSKVALNAPSLSSQFLKSSIISQNLMCFTIVI